jgi:hypothetical protein
MQDRYVGDIGDYAKLALLRALAAGHSIGVAWWRYPDESHNGDGRHIDYLNHPSRWRHLDPQLFDRLCQIVRAGNRQVSALQMQDLLGSAIFCDELVPTGLPPRRLRIERAAWFERVRAKVAGCDLLFLDPDNGLEPKGYSLSSVSGGKCVSVAQLSELATPGRCLVVYHHQTRRKGGHLAELDYWSQRLRLEGFDRVDVVRARPYSPRAFFLLNSSAEIRHRAKLLCEHWGSQMSWYPGPSGTLDARDMEPPRIEQRGLLKRIGNWLRGGR